MLREMELFKQLKTEEFELGVAEAKEMSAFVVFYLLGIPTTVAFTNMPALPAHLLMLGVPIPDTIPGLIFKFIYNLNTRYHIYVTALFDFRPHLNKAGLI